VPAASGGEYFDLRHFCVGVRSVLSFMARGWVKKSAQGEKG